MKSRNLTLMQRIEKNRQSLVKQNAWALSRMSTDILEHVKIEEHQYGSGERERLDFIHSQRDPSIKWPVFIYLHGGGWVAGNKESRQIYCANIAARGYFVVNVEYGLAPENKFPVQIGQIINAIDYIFDVAAAFNLDTDKIVVGGESAGAYYASFISAISKNKSILNQLGLDQMRHGDFDVKVNMFNCGAFDMSMLVDAKFPNLDVFLEAFMGVPFEEIQSGQRDSNLLSMSPIHYIAQDYPDTFLIYGNLDSLRFQSLKLIEKFQALGIKHKVYKSTGIFYGQHTTTMILSSKKPYHVLDVMLSYVNSALEKYQ